MRIIAGRYKGRKLLPVADARVRSTADRVKESLFNILMHDVPNAAVLDLYCGAGALGLEALSRGAESAVFVDLSKRSLAKTLDNVRSLGLEEQAKTVFGDSLRALQSLGARGYKFSLIFADPPYNMGMPAKTLKAAATANCRSETGVVVIEHHKKDEPGEAPPGFSLWTSRRFGDTVLTFWRWGDESSADSKGSS